MATKFLQVMLSSRCNDSIAYLGSKSNLTAVRKDAKKRIEKVTIGKQQLFNCWINEIETAQEGTEDAWEKCLVEASEADVFIVVYNGNAGWANTKGGIGVCHAELQKAFEANPEKCFLLQLPFDEKKLKGTDKRMFEYVQQLNLFRTAVNDGDELIEEILNTLGSATRKLAKNGVSDSGSQTYHLGQALDWSRLDFRKRKAEMERVALSSLEGRDKAKLKKGNALVPLAGAEVLFVCHGIPSAFSVSAAREMVGRPFLNDHELAGDLTSKSVGPVHLIACHKGISESQAIGLFGFPDATIVDPKFGIYIADPIQKIQLLFMRNCRDETSTRHSVQRAFDWLERSGEAQFLVERAASRKKIVNAIAAETKT